MFKKSLFLFAFVLAGCAQPGDDKVEALNTLDFHATPSPSAPANSNPAELESLHKTNQQAIASLTAEIKSARVDELKSGDVFDNRDGIDNVFQALTRLEEFGELNNIYLKDNNKNGLVQIGKVLKPLTEKDS
ncbi:MULTISPECIES: hypothetical protein [Buttiauxella]|uniref:Lipoprotein n=1 Tax=Buttiauxella ferragutiae ATCC 51602 TaxID=1354252 RepID=A0ABX2WD20_9ENTR|nr:MULTISPECIES: hypothetical protein [Buttiauxella]AYN27911.1 hypothetical protein D8682_13530 [Buttiauxella sp. 3AFRM03]OAT32547.1 hypothetical protein M976_00529 [Buttiauxella ferragutiae ATCC 51602]TDN49356.1 hypothetical protein EC843_10832 [Buttiauxella sp. JUb87]UNK61047.1 hypothetical protein MNO13_22355 [Buttiauxella ferragutiae]